MPWDNNSNGGGRPGGPWGQIPGGGGGGPRRTGGGTPNLEDILNRGRDQFRGGVPGGRWLFVGGVALALLIWVSQSVYTIAATEVGVVLAFGQPQSQLAQPGLHFLLWPVERVERVSLLVNQTQIGSNSTGSLSSSGSGFMLTGDQNIIDVSFSVFWQVNNPKDYLFDVRGPDEMVQRAAESAMREVVGRSPASDVFRDNRSGVEQEVRDITQNILTDYGTGIAVSEIKMSNVAPPPEVADAFAEVQRAAQDGDRFQNEARQYANTLLGDARGQAARIRESATAYKDQVVKQAEGEAQRFVSVEQQYAQAPEVTRKRLYLETMESVLSGTQKVIIDKSATGSGVLPYLPLPALGAKSSTGPTTSSTATTATGGQ